ncbi:MAG: sensory rhodopsin transducer [Anditalea sp.]
MEYLLGKTHWAIPEGYIPSKSNGPKPAMESHDSVCILNTSDKEATVEIFIYFEDRDPVGPYKVTVPPKRTTHVRYNELNHPEEIPRDTDYAGVLIADVPIVVQYTRLDSRQSENALLSTIAYS